MAYIYQIYLYTGAATATDEKEEILFDSTTNKKLPIIKPILKTTMSGSGSLEFTLLPDHPLYDEIIPFRPKHSIVGVREYDIQKDYDFGIIWLGRVAEMKTDFYKQRTFYVEGALSYLNDTICGYNETLTKTAKDWLKYFVNMHNSLVVDSQRKFKIGKVTVPNKLISFELKRDNLYAQMKSCLLDNYGGFFSVTYSENTIQPTLNYLNNNISTNSRVIEYGISLLDLEQHFNPTDIKTIIGGYADTTLVIIIVDEDDQEIGREEQHTRLLTTQWASKAVLKKFGRIWWPVDFSAPNVYTQSDLNAAAKKYLESTQYNTETLTVDAAELYHLDHENEPIQVGQKIKVKSEPHLFYKELTVTDVEYDLASPTKKITLGGEAHNTVTNLVSKQKKKRPAGESSDTQIVDAEAHGFIIDFVGTEIIPSNYDTFHFTIYYADGTEFEAKSEVVVSEPKSIQEANYEPTVGPQIVEVSLTDPNDYTWRDTVNAYPWHLKELKIATNPTKMYYQPLDALDFTGIKVNAVFEVDVNDTIFTKEVDVTDYISYVPPAETVIPEDYTEETYPVTLTYEYNPLSRETILDTATIVLTLNIGEEPQTGPGLYDANDRLLIKYDDIIEKYGEEYAIAYHNTADDLLYKNLIETYYPTAVKYVLPQYTQIGTYKFYNCDMLTTFVFPEKLEVTTSYGRINSYAFAGCTGITEMRMPFATRVFSTYAFAGCTSLTTVTRYDGGSLAAMQLMGAYCFQGCENLTYLDIGTGWYVTYSGVTRSVPAYTPEGLADYAVGRVGNYWRFQWRNL